MQARRAELFQSKRLLRENDVRQVLRSKIAIYSEHVVKIFIYHTCIFCDEALSTLYLMISIATKKNISLSKVSEAIVCKISAVCKKIRVASLSRLSDEHLTCLNVDVTEKYFHSDKHQSSTHTANA